MRTLMVSFAFMAVSSVMAQPGPGGPPEGGRGDRGGFGRRMGPPGQTSPLTLASDAEIAKLLNFSEEQVGYLNELRDLSREEDEEFAQSLEGLDRREQFEKFRERQASRVKEIDESLEEIIGKESLERLGQIRLQVMGSMALMSPEISEKVGVTENQRSEMREILRGAFMKFRTAPGGENDSSENPFEAVRKEIDDSLMGVLTDRQRERWNELVGEAVSIDLSRFRQPPDRPQGPGGPERRRRRPDSENGPE